MNPSPGCAGPANLNLLARSYGAQGDFRKMKECYLESIDRGNVDAMVHLGNHYYLRKKTEKMFTYYLMAVDHGSHAAMENLGTYYYSAGDYANLKKYYEMAIRHGNPNAAGYLSQFQEDNRVQVALTRLTDCLKCRNGGYQRI